MAEFRDSPHNLSRIADHSNNINPPQSGQSDWHTDPVWIACLCFPFPLPSPSHYPPYLTQKAPSYHWAERRHSLIISHHIQTAWGKGRPCSPYVFVCVWMSLILSVLYSPFFLSICDSSLEWKLDILHDTHSNVSTFAVRLSVRL